jgi:hypothetical protein
MQGHDAADQVAGLRRDPTMPHAGSPLRFLVASLLADTAHPTSAPRQPCPDLITNVSLKLAPGYGMAVTSYTNPALEPSARRRT